MDTVKGRDHNHSTLHFSQQLIDIYEQAENRAYDFYLITTEYTFFLSCGYRPGASCTLSLDDI